MRRLLCIAFALAACCVGLNAYVLLGYKWPAGNIVMNLQLGPSPSTLIDGSSSWGVSAESALSTWNAQIGASKFTVVRDSTAAIGNGNGINNVFFSDTLYGSAFGSSTLAVTTGWISGTTRVEADVVFNTAFKWDSYSGPLRAASTGGTLIDFRRVALHEFGHALGLGHPDQSGQTVSSIMNSVISNLDQLTTDDIAGAVAMYGPAGGTPTAVSVTPASGSGASQTFVLQYGDTAGATDLASAWVWFSPSLTAGTANSCLLQYGRATNTLFLMNDAGTAWLSAALGAAGALQNSQCSVTLGGSATAVASGNALTVTLPVTFATGFSGTRTTYLYAATASGTITSWQARGSWTVPAPPPPSVTAISATPSTGSGASQTFALQYGDTAGATDLATAWAWINGSLASTSANSCLIQYSRPTNTLFLMNDAGTAFLPGAVVGSAGTLQNSQCTVALGASTSVASSGTSLTMNLAMTFATGFGGAKNVYMYAANGAGVNSGWQARGTWTVPGASAPPVVTAVSATPNVGTGAAQTFALQYGDTAGATDIATAWTWINATLASTSANSCLIQFNRVTNTLFLMNDAGTAFLPGVAIGAAGSLQNSQCGIALGGSSTVVASGTALTLNLAMTFASGFSGAKNIYMYAAGAGGANSGWQALGTWTVPGAAAPPVVTAVSATPNAGTGATQTFALQYGDTAGAADIATAWTWINATFASTSAASCLIQYNRAANTLFLMNDAGTAFLPGAVVGSAGTLQNSQCAIALGTNTTVVASGTGLTLNLAMTFASGFSGAKTIYMYAANAGGANSAWQARGTWTVPGAGTPAVVTAVSATPSAGSGGTQIFALQYGDTAGATDLATAWTWFNATFAATSANSCLLQYNRATNTLFLINDAGTAFLPGAVVGSAGALQNSQCSIALSGTTVVPSGTTLTVNLAMTFKAGFSGTKNIYMYAANGAGVNSGWQTRGTWVVP